MNRKDKKKLYVKLKKKQFSPLHVAEVGVYHPETSNIFDFILDGIRTTLVEPDPRSIELIEERFSAQDNVTLHKVAVYEKDGQIKLAQRDASTFASFLEASPAIINDSYELNENDTFVVEARRFDSIDDGTIDLLSVDTEGCEWYVIKYLVSRPGVISVETHGGIYTNPNFKDIDVWMKTNDYSVWFKDKSDTVYVRNDAIKLNFIDAVELRLTSIFLTLRKGKKLLKRKLKSLFKR